MSYCVQSQENSIQRTDAIRFCGQSHSNGSLYARVYISNAVGTRSTDLVYRSSCSAPGKAFFFLCLL